MVRIRRVTKRYAVGKVEKITDPSPDRVEPPCPIYHRCGGCQLQHIAYHKQLDYKKRFVGDSLGRIGGLADIPVLDPLGMENPYAYRNKIQHLLSRRGNRVITGFYLPRSHDIVPVDKCLLYDEKGNRIIKLAREVKFDVIIVDPPRRGCDRKVIDLISGLHPGKLVYVSCDPSTLARDLALLNERGYETVRVQPVDMFPQTYHIECVAEVVPQSLNSLQS